MYRTSVPLSSAGPGNAAAYNARVPRLDSLLQFLAQLPRLRLGHFPTPLVRLDRLSETLDLDLWMKRDDCSGLALGGNKTRKLEFLLGDALAKGCDTLVTVGAAQSNHCRQTAAAAAKAIGPALVCEHPPAGGGGSFGSISPVAAFAGASVAPGVSGSGHMALTS